MDRGNISVWGRKVIEQNTGWTIRFVPSLEQTLLPNETELAVLCNLHARTEITHNGKETLHAGED